MRVLILSALCLLATTLAASAQTSPASASAETNLRDFDFMVEKITTSYAGYEIKVTDANRNELQALTARLRAEAARASDSEILPLLQQWIAFFGDRHTIVNTTGSAPTATSATSAQRFDWSEQDVMRQLRALGRRRDPIEGIWQMDAYRLAVLRAGETEGAFAAVVLSTTAEGWSPGEVKAEITRNVNGSYRLVYRQRNRGVRTLTGSVSADGLALDLSDNFFPWIREAPGPVDPVLVARRHPTAEVFLRRLSPSTLWIRIPDFNDSRTEAVRNLIASNADALNATPNLIIDLRNNGGGSDFVYAPLVPLIYTRPIYVVGMEMRASADNIALREQVAANLEQASPETAADIRRQNVLMGQHLGGYINPDPAAFGVETFDEVRVNPRRVAVLIDGAGSTGEQFLLAARQSRKVTLFGQRNSAGVLDFANVVAMTTPSGRFRVQWATSRSLRLPSDPVDPDGIAPDIRIPANEIDAVGYAQRWLERQVD